MLTKCVAGRDRDWEFARVAIRHGLVEPEELLRRIPDLPLPEGARERLQQTVAGMRVGRG